jgi:hypothetical protein
MRTIPAETGNGTQEFLLCCLSPTKSLIKPTFGVRKKRDVGHVLLRSKIVKVALKRSSLFDFQQKVCTFRVVRRDQEDGGDEKRAPHLVEIL